MRAWGRLLRLSLTASALADAAAGILLGAGGWPTGGAPWLLLLASACVYHGGMALNDWADRAADARSRPERPLPSGAIGAGAALALGLALLAVGSALGLALDRSAGLVLGTVAALALVYDLAGRGPWLGPTLLGLCRAGNLLAGILLGASLGSVHDAGALPSLFWTLPLGYGAFVFVVSRLGRLEDAEDAVSARVVSPRALVRLIALLLLLPAPLAWLSGAVEPLAPELAAALGIGILGAVGLVRYAQRMGTRPGADVLPAMGMSLRRLLLFTAQVALVAGALGGEGSASASWLGAAAILAGYPLSFALKRAFPPS